jgi:Trypsin-co-occurring domain 1
MASTRLIKVTVGKADIAIETVPAPGSELTFGPKAQDKAKLAFATAHDAIVALAEWTADMIDTTVGLNARPDQLELEFGLRFSAAGGVILAAASDQASLHVTLTYSGTQQSAGRSGSAVPEAGVASAAGAI